MALSSSELQDQARSDNPSQIFTNNSLGGLIYKACATNQSITIPQYTTLNEFFDLFGADSIGKKQARDLTLKYFCLGLNGSEAIGKTASGLQRMRVNGHQPIDQRLFAMCPLIARPLDNDLDAVQRAKYRCRVVGTYNGIAYAVYYVGLGDFSDYNPHEVEIEVDVTTGQRVPVQDPYIHLKDNLMNVKPLDYTANGTVPTAKRFINGTSIIDCSLDASDLAEIANACKIVFGDPSVAAINEFCVLWGMDVERRGDIAQGGQIVYQEALSLIPAHFLSQRDGRSADANSALTLRFDHGNSDPLLLATNSTTSSTGN